MVEAIAVKIRDFVQEGLLEPAHAILANKVRGEVRFSVLVPQGDEFVMRHALGHDVASRRAFRLRIHESFAGLAYNEREVKHSPDTTHDERFTPHPRARPGREYRSIVAVPLWEGESVFGVFVAVAQRPKAFSRADRIYIRVLAAIIDVARATGTIRRDADKENDA
jgi:transcriptional regulator with GAF, ATPase, and Fis domain